MHGRAASDIFPRMVDERGSSLSWADTMRLARSIIQVPFDDVVADVPILVGLDREFDSVFRIPPNHPTILFFLPFFCSYAGYFLSSKLLLLVGHQHNRRY